MDGLRHGKGKLFKNNGDITEGDWEKGKLKLQINEDIVKK